MGYFQAGFSDIMGVDNRPQSRYPFQYIQADALEYLEEHGQEYDVIHASPPCQGYSIMNNLPWLRGKTYPLLIKSTLEILEVVGKPYVLENVMGARYRAKGLAKRGLESHGLQAGMLCGAMFGKSFYRYRLFASNYLWLAPPHPRHQGVILSGSGLGSRARTIAYLAGGSKPRGTWERGFAERHPGQRFGNEGTLAKWQGNGAQANGVAVGHAKGWHLAAEAMGIDWMRREELTQAVPPVYTEFIGHQLLRVSIP